LARFDALSGLILVADVETLVVTWDARLQFPCSHFDAGSGQAVQYHAEENSALRLHPPHCSTVVWQTPPLNEHPLGVIKRHSIPFLTVVQTIGTTSFTNKLS
jgi:hypothetical protein